MKLYNINFLEDLDITSNVILALLYYKRNERLSQQAIMNAFKISKKSVYNHLKILEKNEYIKIRSIGKVGEKVQYKTILTTKTMQAYYYTTQKQEQKAPKGKKIVPVPAWYKDYKAQLDTGASTPRNGKSVQELAKELFKEN